MKLSKTQIQTVIVAIVMLVFFGVYSTLFVVIKNKNNQISILQNQVDIEVRKDQRLHSVKQLISDLDEEIMTIDSHFVSTDGVVDFLESLESLGRISGASVDVNSVNVDEKEDLPYELLEIKFVARGSWSETVQLISLLETLPLGVTIERMQLERLASSSLWQVNSSFIVLKLK